MFFLLIKKSLLIVLHGREDISVGNSVSKPLLVKSTNFLDA